MMEDTFVAAVARKMNPGGSKSFDATPISGPWGDKTYAECAKPVDARAEIDSSASQLSPVCEPLDTAASVTGQMIEVKEANIERPKLSFSENGRLVGTRRYGPMCINIRKIPHVVVYNEDKPDVVNSAEPDAAASSAGCILL
jgi:hypothetical protein